MKSIAILMTLFACAAQGASELKNSSEKKFFSKLQEIGLVQRLYRVEEKSPFLAGVTFSKLEEAPLKVMKDCAAVLCHDVELQKKLNAEMRRGRLVLVTDAFKGFVGALIAETPETILLRGRLAPAATKKGVLVVTPKTLMTTVAHELTHAEDGESGVLEPLLKRTQELHQKGRLSAAHGRTINQFVGEVRAYENEMRYLMKHSRSKEFLADEGGRGALTVRTAEKREFLFRRLQEIDEKVRDLYLPEFLKALRESELARGERRGLIAAMRDLLPPKGPYSFVHLVEPRL